MFRSCIAILSTAFLFTNCARHHAARSAPASYYQSIRAWQKHRDEGLRSPSGWLALVGLFWLKPGINTIGCGAANDFVLPSGECPDELGRLRVDPDKVTFMNYGGIHVLLDGNPILTNVTLNHDEEHPDVVQAGTISLVLIKRGDKIGVRARSSESPELKNFKGMEYFPTDPDFDFKDARFIPNPRKIPILNIIGQTEKQDSPGEVEFSYNGKKYRLRPIYEGNTLFFLFKDATNHSTTYPAGRMLNTPLPQNGKVDLDFNRAYNPPCTFTPYATCPLPPKDNELPFAVSAGEKRYANSHEEAPLPEPTSE